METGSSGHPHLEGETAERQLAEEGAEVVLVQLIHPEVQLEVEVSEAVEVAEGIEGAVREGKGQTEKNYVGRLLHHQLQEAAEKSLSVTEVKLVVLGVGVRPG